MAQSLYLWFPGNAAEALNHYHSIFGGKLEMFTFEQFERTEGPPDAIAHGVLSGPVELYGTDAVEGEDTVNPKGVAISLLGVADGTTLTSWFEALSQDGAVLDPLAHRAWGATDGQVVDKFGVRWLIGFEDGH
ncbi:VOC family protein [Timonella senegalensis]|uniref:VOC family protein n=1 Tax=Timonella senegalensis TaxID=1465825 RepID=UPI002FDE040F